MKFEFQGTTGQLLHGTVHPTIECKAVSTKVVQTMRKSVCDNAIR